MIDVHSQLLFLGVLPEHLFGIMVAERKRVDRLVFENPAHPKVSPFRPTATKEGRVGLHQKKQVFSMYSKNQPVKAGWQCGQQAKNNLRV